MFFTNLQSEKRADQSSDLSKTQYGRPIWRSIFGNYYRRLLLVIDKVLSTAAPDSPAKILAGRISLVIYAA